jgi:hypothetical protein
MTIFELFPWFIAVGVTVLSAALLTNKVGLSGLWAWIIAAVLGGASWAAYWLVLKRLGPHFHQRKAEKEKRQLASRTYHQFDAAKGYPAAKNLYYECAVCGNVVPSMPGKKVSCKCRNVAVDASDHPTVQNHEKVKLFSAPE